MAGVAGRAAKFWADNKVTVVMGGILVGGHFVWRWMQEQEEFVPKGQQKEYPWIEVAKHVKEAQAAAKAPIGAGVATGGEK